MSISLLQQAERSADFLGTFETAPKIALVLGSGLSTFAERLHNTVEISYEDIPYFWKSTVPGHAGKLVIGTLSNDVRIAALCGRTHLYEGHTPDVIVHPTRALAMWGCKTVIYTNAAGGIASGFAQGDLMLITDHINLTGKNPLVGPKEDSFGDRFIDMTQAYDQELCDAIRRASQQAAIAIQEGVYISLLGPSYETPAEIKMYQTIGASAVGMSTVLEVIAARQLDMRVAGISCITNLAAGLQNAPLSHAEVKETAQMVRSKFEQLLERSMLNISSLDTLG